MADRAHLAQLVGERHELGGPLEERAPEVGPQAVAQDRDGEIVRDAGELAHLLARQELGLVDEDRAERSAREARLNRGEQVEPGPEQSGRCGQPDARADLAGLRPRQCRVVGGGPQHHRHAALAIIMGGLQEDGRLARVHRAVCEVELGHASPISAIPRGRHRRQRAAAPPADPYSAAIAARRA